MKLIFALLCIAGIVLIGMILLALWWRALDGDEPWWP